MKFEFTQDFLDALSTLPKEKMLEGMPVKFFTTEGVEVQAVAQYMPAREVYCLILPPWSAADTISQPVGEWYVDRVECPE